MTQVPVEIEGSADEVVRVLQHLGSVGRQDTAGAGGSTERSAGSGDGATPASGRPGAVGSDEAVPAEWTEALAREFLAGLVPEAWRVTRHIWQGGASGIHRSALCQYTELTPRELSLLVMRMGRALGGFQREHGVVLSRPVAANSPLQSYFVDPEFAAAAESWMFDERMQEPLADGAGGP